MNKSLIIKDSILAVLAVISAWIAQSLGGWDSAMVSLIVIMAIDYITGVLIAAVWHKSPKSKCGTVDSRAGFKGLLRKVAILLAVLIAVRLDVIMNLPGVVRTATILFFIGNEGISVVENLGIMGVPLPPIIKKSLDQLKDKGEAEELDDAVNIEVKRE